MTLSRSRIVDAAIAIVDQYGLASLSMRHLAKALNVQPGALYWHVKSKQDLLATIAERILSRPLALPVTGADPVTDIRAITAEFRTALLQHRDAAEIVTLAQALTDAPLPPRRDLQDALAQILDPVKAEWAAKAITRYTLGAVSEQQNHADLISAGILAPETVPTDPDLEFRFGIDAILHGLAQQPAPE